MEVGALETRRTGQGLLFPSRKPHRAGARIQGFGLVVLGFRVEGFRFLGCFESGLSSRPSPLGG